ncbi:MAG: DNA protecting protein DprA [candidate division Zixibacteria bacterium RBG_16_53_22]|nr:MAG: DNA protecting protein DprA [candidate division Zixibacteria bacterium RBG_16_53_22]
MIDEKLAIWALANTDGVGPAILFKLVTQFGSAAAVLESSAHDLYKAEIVNQGAINKILQRRDWDQVRAGFQKSFPDRACFVAVTESTYPAKLRNIPDPPPFLYYQGRLDIFERPSLAVVGSRRPTDYGIRMTSRIVSELASTGVIIISGLAYGIDAAAHQAALDSGGQTAAVFGCGLDIVYPPGHKALAQRIEQSGCLLSEFPRGTRPERYNFPVRNRIVAGLSDGVLVVEAGGKSGALVTAGIALEQGKDVLAMPGSVEAEQSLGPNSLIKQGAVAVTGADDIFANFGWHRSDPATRPAQDLSRLSKEELSVFGLLSVQPIHLDELGRKVALGPGKVAEALLNLELKGLIMRKPGNYVVKA